MELASEGLFLFEAKLLTLPFEEPAGTVVVWSNHCSADVQLMLS
jgi:hypothetical protein